MHQLPLSCSQNTLVARHCLSAFPWRYIRAKVCALRRAGSNETRKRRSNTLHETCSIYQRLRDAPARVLGTCIFAFDAGRGQEVMLGNVGKSLIAYLGNERRTFFRMELISSRRYRYNSKDPQIKDFNSQREEERERKKESSRLRLISKKNFFS